MSFRVIVGVTSWNVGGVESFAGHLVRGLGARGVPAHVFVTQPGVGGAEALPLPSDISVKQSPWTGQLPLRSQWRAMIRYLEGLAPCVYVPNNDYNFSCISPGLSNRVAVVGHIHGDSSEHYEHFGMLGSYWNSTVACSTHVAQKAASLYPSLAQRLVVIPYGVPMPTKTPTRVPAPGTPLRIVYTGRLKQAVKRVLDLPLVVEALARRQVPVRLSITGSGPDESALKAACRPLANQGFVRFLGVVPEEQLPEIYEENDTFILTSDHEGKPLSLVQAMGHGCVPVVTEIPSGIPELVHDGHNGYRVPVGAIEAFADRLSALYHDRNLYRRLSLNAYATVAQGEYRIEDMASRYIDLFEQVWADIQRGAYHRQRGRIKLPPFVPHRTWKDWLPAPVRSVARHCKRMFG